MSQTDFFSVGIKKAFIRLIAKHTGLEIRERDQADVIEKIFLRMKEIQISFPENYYQLLDSLTPSSHQEWQKLISLLTNLESYFFRDKEQFNLLRNFIFPELIQHKQYNKTLRICSAGCSTGEEAYSLAILLKEIIPYVEQWQLTILGVDINQNALQQAQAGIYTSWSLRSIEPEIKQQYFLLINNEYHLAQQIKQMVKFKYLNLVQDSYDQLNSEMQDIDLIICRNVFIYLEKSAIGKILDNFHYILQPSGYLITGHTELCGQNLSNFHTRVFPESLVYMKNK